uniref:Uncharacterized protein n=1 Tax=Ganoderma calidophilum TaxID=2026244 RepID=A0A2S1WBQ3_9APHY|nr:hypothetical protein [Ganoderma calidophilum]AWJ64001.1 hypothetical protein [Ganoderma calidophilum]
MRGEGYTNTCITIGMTIMKDVYMRLYHDLSRKESFIEQMKEPSFYIYSFDNFVKFLNIKNVDSATIGAFFLSFMMNGDSQIFELQFSSYNDKNYNTGDARYMLKFSEIK